LSEQPVQCDPVQIDGEITVVGECKKMVVYFFGVVICLKGGAIHPDGIQIQTQVAIWEEEGRVNMTLRESHKIIGACWVEQLTYRGDWFDQICCQLCEFCWALVEQKQQAELEQREGVRDEQ